MGYSRLTWHDVHGSGGRQQGEDGVELLHRRRHLPLLLRVEAFGRPSSFVSPHHITAQQWTTQEHPNMRGMSALFHEAMFQRVMQKHRSDRTIKYAVPKHQNIAPTGGSNRLGALVLTLKSKGHTRKSRRGP